VLIPLGTDRPLSRPTQVTYALLLLNVAVFMLQWAASRGQAAPVESLLEGMVLVPGESPFYTYLSYAFLHGGLMHILGNMLFLWVFGPNVEDRLGRLGFLVFYLFGAMAAGVIHGLVYPNPVVGASGAIAAITGAYLVLFPHTTIKTLLFFILIGIINIPAWWFIGARIAFDLFAEALGAAGNVATLAHLGAYGFGIGISMLLLWTGLIKREPYDLFSISRQAKRRRAFREVTHSRERHIRQGKHPDLASRRGRLDEAQAEELAQARADVATHLSEDDPAAAAAAYRRLLNQFASVPRATLLHRRIQYDLANHIFKAGDHQTAATAYEIFLEGYPRDPEAANVRLILGLINARYLNDPVRAKQHISVAVEELPPGPQRDLAKELLAELG
jgi:membrane associated rhomboid family serine protease